MSAPWEDFGGSTPAAAPARAGPWSDFGTVNQAPVKIGADAFPDFLRRELANTDWGTRNIAGFGTALSDLWEGAKQFVGKGDQQQIQANKIIEHAAPIGSIAGNVAMTAIPFGMVGNSVAGAAKVGTVLGALNPVEGDQSAANVVAGKLKSTALGGILGAAGQKVANAGGEFLSNKMADLAALIEKNAPRTKTVNDALDAGLSLPPTSVDPTWWNQLKESIGGKIATGQTASNRNASLVDDLARAELHLPETAPLTPGTLQEARGAAYRVGYKPVQDVASVRADDGLLNDLISLSPASKGGAVPNPAQSQISDLIDNLANKGEWSGQQLVGDIRSLRTQSRNNYRAAGVPGGNPGAQDLAHAQGAAADALEGLAQRNITAQGGSGDALQLMREARQYIAKAHDVEDALVGGGGTLDARVLARKADNGAPLTGNLAVVGNAANNFPKAFQPYAQVNGPGVSKLDLVLAAAGAAGGYGGGGGEGGIAGALLPLLASRTARAQLLSRASQNRLRDIYQLGLAPRVAAGALQYAPVAGTVLGREALSQ